MYTGPKLVKRDSIIYSVEPSSERSVASAKETNILDYSVWTAGSSSASGFSRNGESECNIIEYNTGPFGENAVIWASRNNDTTSDADGGWNSSQYAIDNTKMYRLCVWVYREVNGDGSFYFGSRGYTNGTNTGLTRMNTNVTTTNPYFWSGSINSSQGWQLFVAHIWPTGTDYTIGNHPESGRYSPDGTKFGSISYDYIFPAGTTHANHRTYLYYSVDPSTVQLWAYPRVDLVDGTEPPLTDLFGNTRKVKHLKSGAESFLSNNLRSRTAANVKNPKTKTLKLNGVDDYIGSTLTIPSTFTISCWFQHGPNQGWGGSYEQHLVASNDNWTQGRYRLYLSGSNQVHFYEYDQGVTGTITHNDTQWHHVVVTHNSSGLVTLYFDGTYLNSAVRSINITTSNMAVGRLYVGSSDIRYFNGSIGQIKIYSESLSASEVSDLYDVSKNRYRI